MTEQKEQQESTDQKHMFPSLPENINYIENKLCHSDDIKNWISLFKTEKEQSYISNL